MSAHACDGSKQPNAGGVSKGIAIGYTQISKESGDPTVAQYKEGTGLNGASELAIIPGATERRVPHLPSLRRRSLCIAVASVVSAGRRIDLPNNPRRLHDRTIGSDLRAPRKTHSRRDGSAMLRCEPATA
jgi:hypothetical protein